MRHLLSTLLLGPLLIYQGRRVRSSIELLPEPPGKRSGVTGQGERLNVLIVGDSAAAGVGAPSQALGLLGRCVEALANHFEVHYRLEAKTGDNTRDCVSRLEGISAYNVDVVVASLGVNDVTSGLLETRFTQNQILLTQLLKEKFSARQIILSGMPPMGELPALPHPLRWYLGAQAKRFDKRIQAISEKHNLDYIAFEFDGDPSLIATDGFHPGPRVYELWSEAIAKKVLSKRRLKH